MKKNNDVITKELFYADMTRDEVCRLYADLCGQKYNFTNKDYAWVDEYKYVSKQSDEFLLKWCKINMG